MHAPQQVSDAIILSRTDYGEADRIITMLTPDHGKLRLMAKGVRRVKSKLAGGIELFSITNVTFIKGRGEIGTLVSARLQAHYAQIVHDLDRTMLGYDLIKQLNRVTEDVPEADYFHLLQESFAALNDLTIGLDLIRVWFSAQLLRLNGYAPNLGSQPDGTKLTSAQRYEFSFDDSAFVAKSDGPYDPDVIKFLRLIFSGNAPHVLAKVQRSNDLTGRCLSLVTNLKQIHLRLG